MNPLCCRYPEAVLETMNQVFTAIRKNPPEGMDPDRWQVLTERHWPPMKPTLAGGGRAPVQLPASMGDIHAVTVFAPCTIMFAVCAPDLVGGGPGVTSRARLDSRGSFKLLQYAIQRCLGSSRWIQLKGLLRQVSDALKAPYSLLQVHARAFALLHCFWKP
jgi:hypothetical protein